MNGCRIKWIFLVLCFLCYFEGKAQGLLFRELYAPQSAAELNVSHRQATSSWHSPYSRLSKTNVNISSETFSCGRNQCGYKFQAAHGMQRFGNSAAFGDTLERPEFSALIDYPGRHRFLAEFGISSPSNKPFDSIHETNINFTAALAPLEDLRKKAEPYWIYFLNYSNNRSFLPNIPLPGFTYVIPTRAGWVYSLGAPFISATYMNFPKWSFRLMGGPFFYSTEVSYGPPVFQMTLSSSWKQDSYFIAERARREERVFLDERDISLALKHPLNKKVFFEWKVSYFFHQALRYGESYSSETAPAVDLGTSAAVALSVKARLDSIAKR